MTILIGICGARGAGKDTAYKFIKEWSKTQGFISGRRGYADALKWSFYRLIVPDCSQNEALVWADGFKRTGKLHIEDVRIENGEKTSVVRTIDGRLAFQRYGSEAHRDIFGNDFWIDLVLPNKDYAVNFRNHSPFDDKVPDICVITDVRLDNEAQRILELGGNIYKIERDEAENDDGHESEWGIDDWYIDFYIDNNGSLEDFKQNIFQELDELVKFHDRHLSK